MIASELKSCIERMILQYGDLEIIFKDEYKNNVYDIKDVMVSFLKKEDDKFILITNNNKSREIYLDDVVSKVDDTQLFKKLKGNGNRSRQGFMIWNMRSYKNNEEITNFEII